MEQNNNTTNKGGWRRWALAEAHRYKRMLGMSDDEWRALLSNWNTESSATMAEGELQQLLSRLAELSGDQPQTDELALWRRRVYGVIGAFLTAKGYEPKAAVIRELAVRGSHDGCTFRELSVNKLKHVYIIYAERVKQLEQQHRWGKKERR